MNLDATIFAVVVIQTKNLLIILNDDTFTLYTPGHHLDENNFKFDLLAREWHISFCGYYCGLGSRM